MAITSVGVAYKTPDEVKDYSIDYSNVLGQGETVMTSTWRCTSSFLKAKCTVSLHQPEWPAHYRMAQRRHHESGRYERL
jgi:hypothetical protein